MESFRDYKGCGQWFTFQGTRLCSPKVKHWKPDCKILQICPPHLSQQNSHHHFVGCPKQPPIRLPRSRHMRKPVAWICCTFLSWDWTAEQSPPQSGRPQLQDCCKWPTSCCLKPPHIPELTLIYWTVTTSVWIAPSNQWRPRLQQMHGLWLEFAAHFWADLSQQNNHHHFVGCPKQPPIRLPRSRHKPVAWICCTSWADLELPSSHHRSASPQATADPSARIAANALCPRQLLIRRPRLLQRRRVWPEYVTHSWAEIERRSSHHLGLDCPE